jgi:hypothetical protein
MFFIAFGFGFLIRDRADAASETRDPVERPANV